MIIEESNEDVDLSRDDHEDQKQLLHLNQSEYETLEQNLIKSLRSLRINANRDQTKLSYDVGSIFQPNTLQYQTLRLFNERLDGY